MNKGEFHMSDVEVHNLEEYKYNQIEKNKKRLEDEKHKRKRQRRRTLLIIIIALLLLLALGSWGSKYWKSRQVEVETEQPTILKRTDLISDEFEFEFDDSSVSIEDREKLRKETQDLLNQQVAEGEMNITMNSIVIFKNYKSEGVASIENKSINRYPQVVEIIENSTGDLLYKSKGIALGSKIETITLEKKLRRGKYPSTAYFYAIDPDTGNIKGKAGSKITIEILK